MAEPAVGYDPIMRKWLLLMLLVVSAAGLAVARPTRAPMEALDAEGRTHRPLQVEGVATVLVFVDRACPAAQRYAPEIARLQREFGPRGVAFYLVDVAPAGPEQARLFLHDHGLEGLPLLADPSAALAGRVGATITPEAAVVTLGGRVAYRGRIDDLYYALGRTRPAATRHDLQEALEAVLAGRRVPQRFTTAYGCLIPGR